MRPEMVSPEELGGADVHCRVSGVTDHYAEDDRDALAIARRSVAGLNQVKHPIKHGASHLRMRMTEHHGCRWFCDQVQAGFQGPCRARNTHVLCRAHCRTIAQPL